MNRNRFMSSVFPAPRPKTYPDPMFTDKKDLEIYLTGKGLEISINEPLKGGTVSQVYSATLKGKKVVVKHVDNLIPFDPTEFFINKNGFKIDVLVLKKLADKKGIRVPKVIGVFPKANTAIMEDMRESGSTLLNDQIMAGKLNLNSAEKIGRAVASLAKESRSWKEFATNESAEQSVYERGLELRLAYPNSQKQYLELEKEFTTNRKYFCWPDGHPKNIFVNPQGDCAFIDFGRSVWADQRYMLPNFLAHIVIYGIAGFVEKSLVRQYLKMCIAGYKEGEGLDERIFCKYLGMEILHRANGKWIFGVEKSGQKLDLYRFGLTVFDEEITAVDSLIRLI